MVYWLGSYQTEAERYDELVLVNRDGSGRTSIQVPDCNPDVPLVSEEPNAIIATLGSIYLVQPPQPYARLIAKEFSSCHSAFKGDTDHGFLASIYQPGGVMVPELRVYELPSGQLLDQFSLVNPPNQIPGCSWGNLEWTQLKWSPVGRYLAFPAVLDGPTTDLYIYDIENKAIQRRTSGPEQVGLIEWSPDGQWILLGENNGCGDLTISALWSISASKNENRLLYTLQDPFSQGIFEWLDDERFLVFDGTSLENALDLPAYHLRLVDIRTGEVRTLFEGGFYVAALDKVHEAVAIYTQSDGSTIEQATYLISIAEPTPQFITYQQVQSWDQSSGLFITDSPCDPNKSQVQAFNYQGEWQCVTVPFMPASLSSPDGQWQVKTHEGVWVERVGQPASQVSGEQPTQVIWCPDSTCFFFISNQVLYHVALADLAVRVSDNTLPMNQIVYQWLDH